jgi:hypothetical protein
MTNIGSEKREHPLYVGLSDESLVVKVCPLPTLRGKDGPLSTWSTTSTIPIPSAKMTDENMGKLPVKPAPSVQQTKNRLQRFVEAGVPVTEPFITMIAGSLKRGASHSLHLISESKTIETEL